jgi:hypothetical protein
MHQLVLHIWFKQNSLENLAAPFQYENPPFNLPFEMRFRGETFARQSVQASTARILNAGKEVGQMFK